MIADFTGKKQLDNEQRENQKWRKNLCRKRYELLPFASFAIWTIIFI